MKNNKKQLTRTDKKSLKQCLQNFPSNEPLYLVFQLSNQLPEVEEIFQSTDLHSNNLFTLYTINQSHFLCVHDHAELFDNLNPATFGQLSRLIKKSYKNNAGYNCSIKSLSMHQKLNKLLIILLNNINLFNNRSSFFRI
jgi:hypothetical protein